MRALLKAQQPDLADLPLRHMASGWDSAIYRLGSQWCVRLPRRAQAVPLLLNEQRWLPTLAPRLPVGCRCQHASDAKAPSFRGHGALWSGKQAAVLEAEPGSEFAANDLIAFLRALHVAPPQDAPRNPVRGCPLEHRAGAFAARLARVAKAMPIAESRLRAVWDMALAASADIGAPPGCTATCIRSTC